MDFKWILPVLFLVLVIFVSGCAEGGDLQSIFSALSEEQEVVVAPKDALVIEDLRTIPDPPINADSDFTLTFQVVNIGETTEGSKEAKNVEVTVYDSGRCNIKSPKTAFSELDIYPGGGSELAEWDFTAPDNKKLGYMEGKCSIRFVVRYKYDAHTTSDISIISTERLNQASRTGETLTISPSQVQSRGPIKIRLDFEVTQPVDEKLTIPLIIKVYDQGSGMYDKVLPSTPLVIEFPPGLKVLNCTPTNRISLTGSSSGGYTATSVSEISLIKGETPPIRCDLEVDEDINDIKTYFIKAKILNYEYPLYGEKSVTIIPTYR
ncbi:MAG: hypothetical protein JSV92_01025 [archaeon]|nr:MAG: hypothetical protein JSV92_01025 [archaeon]